MGFINDAHENMAHAGIPIMGVMMMVNDDDGGACGFA